MASDHQKYNIKILNFKKMIDHQESQIKDLITDFNPPEHSHSYGESILPAFDSGA
jgi:hypothetical protein